MKRIIRTLFLFMPFLCILVGVTSFAKDTDLYMATGEGVEPNILIMFDNSGSMNDEVQTRSYNNAVTYDALVVPLANRDAVYRRSSGSWILAWNSIADVPCASARTALANYGNYAGNTNATCSSTNRTLRTGNYRNYLATGGDEWTPKLTIAKQVIRDFLQTINGVRIGLMVFNNDDGGRIHSTIRSLDATTRGELTTDINNINAETWTPLAETLYEARLYFKGGPSFFNSGVQYTSPIQYHCQRNYVVIITDGMSTQDRNSVLPNGSGSFPAIGDRDSDGREPIGAPNDPDYPSYGSDYLDDVAKYMYDTDLRSDMTGQQNIITYTIGFTIDNDLLERTAAHGHGRYYYSNNAQELANAFQNIVGDILERASSFVAPIVPVSRMERTTAGDKIYLALFQPNQNRMWSGNIKKFGINQPDSVLNPDCPYNPLLPVGALIDGTCQSTLDDNGQILETSHSFWPSPFVDNRMDGSDVEKGGVGDILMNRASERNIYTYMATSVNLTDSTNAFITTNVLITPTSLGLLASDTSGKNNLIQFVRGFDAYDDDGNGNTTEKRDWILGAFLHSKPAVIHYASRSVIFAGSNDGMLHAFDDATGEELWGFIPPNLLTKLQALHADVLESFVDGSPKAYVIRDSNGSITRAILMFGERRGGNRYYALDITNPLSPQYLWEINPDIVGSTYAEMGQTWSTPVLGKIAYGVGEKWVAFIGGGYDDNQDNEIPVADDRGRAIYVVDVLDGSLVRRFSASDSGYSSMAYSIPSDIARLDTDGNGRIDRLYVGDMGGQVWRFDIGNSTPANWTGRIIFQSNPGADATTGRKIFYPPDVTLERDNVNYEMLFFGTGDRENPKETSIVNRLYAVKDKNSMTPVTETDLIDVTEDLLQDSDPEGDAELRSDLRTGRGWYIKLNLNSGEKSLSPAVVFNRTAYFTTFTPTFGIEGDPCFVGEGTARVYAMEYNTGNAVFNFDATNDTTGTVISRSDRSKVIGTAIPSGLVITFIGGKAVGYVGVGGGVQMPTVEGRNFQPLYWKTVF